MKRFVCHINNILTRIGKLFTVTGIILLVLILPGACGNDDLVDADEIEYTDVEYSKDGSQITIYLDGVGVPKTPAQRALSKDLAQTAFDLIEVIFVNGAFATAGNVVRASWILGQPANVENIWRGVNYNRCYPDTSTQAQPGNPAATGIAACMFVGRDDNKTLLGVGKLTGTSTGGTTITADTVSITFSLVALQTGLLVGNEAVGGVGIDAVADSFSYYGATSTNGGYITRVNNSYRRTLAGKSYPVYALPLATGEGTPDPGDPSATYTLARYTFSFSGGVGMADTSEYRLAIRHDGGDSSSPLPKDVIKVTKKTPRYVDGIKNFEPRSSIDTLTVVKLSSQYLDGSSAGGYNTVGYRFQNEVLLRFSTSSSKGLFSFSLEIPVFMVSKTAAGRNNGPEAVKWKIRTGVGTEFYSIDDGVSRGGCVLMSTGFSEGEFVNIEWTWFR